MSDKKPDQDTRPDQDKRKAGPPPTVEGPATGKPEARPAPALPPPAGPAAAPATGPAATRARRRDMVPAMYLLGFVVLAAAVIWLFENPPVPPPPAPSPEVAALREQVATLQERLAKLEQRPAPAPAAPPNLAPINDALAVLQGKVNALQERKPPAPPDLAPLQAAIAALQARPTVDPALAGRVDALGGRMDALTGRVDAGQAATQQRQTATESRLAPLEKDAGQITALADRAARIARIQAAQSALDGGQTLGAIAGAPPALARYAAAAPPTEASLRLSFGAAAQAALAASRPAVDDKPFLDRAWAQAQQLVTLRQGDHVILGDPAAGVIARARAALDAGDLAGAVAALGALSGPPAAAMADWKAQAQGLLDARKAIADMAAHA